MRLFIAAAIIPIICIAVPALAAGPRSRSNPGPMRSTFTAEAKWTRAVSSPGLHTGLHWGGEVFRAALHDLRRVRTALGTERRWARVVAGGRGSAFFRDAPTVHDGLHGRKNTSDGTAPSFVTNLCRPLWASQSGVA